jgi:hypothetical protein
MAKQRQYNPKLHKEKLIKALIKHLGIVSKACEEVGISRNQFYIYCRTDAAFKEEVDDINEITLDFVEDKLFQNIREGDRSSIMFYIKYKGRKRGYVDSSDVNISGGLDINLKNMFGFEDENSIEE